MANPRLVLLLLVLLPTHAGAEDAAVSVRQLASDRFELTATLPAAATPEQAQVWLLPVSSQVCGGREPRLGQYRFESSAKLGEPSGAGTQTFVQVVDCGPASPSADAPAAPLTPPSTPDEQHVRDRTIAYLRAKDEGDFDRAAAMFGDEMRGMMRADNWRDPRAAFNAAGGEPSSRQVVRITWYDDPAGAPAGRYAAADYRGDYAHRGFYCGFLMWRLQPDGEFRLVREEEGQLDDATAASIDPAALAGVRAQLGCRD